jgi:hypothetical protein
MYPKPLGEFETLIQKLSNDDIGLDLHKIGSRTFEKVWPVKNYDLSDLNQDEILGEINPVMSEIVGHNYYDRPIWSKINVLDQAVNEYIGFGHFSFGAGWLDFILKYLNYDRADQGGDTLFLILDPDLSWAFYFEFSVEFGELKIEKYKK